MYLRWHLEGLASAGGAFDADCSRAVAMLAADLLFWTCLTFRAGGIFGRAVAGGVAALGHGVDGETGIRGGLHCRSGRVVYLCG
jgi:hypothetical protein